MINPRSFLIQNSDRFFAKCPKLEDIYLPLRAQIVLRKYRRCRERYAAICRDRGLVYSETDTINQVRDRLSQRGYKPRKRKLGEVHTFAFIPRLGWHFNLYDDLGVLGPVSEFDYVSLGYDWFEFQKADSAGLRRRKEMNSKILPAIEAANRERPIDWIFCYASGLEMSTEVIREIAERLGIPTVNMCLDDKQSWIGGWMGNQRAGQIDLAPIFDLVWTSSRVASGWYLAEGGRPIFLTEGCNIKTYFSLPIKQDIDACFVGQNYGFRSSVVRFLRKSGIDVQVFGRGWDKGPVSNEKIVEIFCRSKINLGMGGIGPAEYLTNVKGRDFDIPCTGGGMYITSFSPDLSSCFDAGREVVFYRSRDEMIELARYYLDHPEEAQEIARVGQKRCLREHRWLHRYAKICQVLGILDSSLSPSSLIERAGLSEV